MINELPVDRNKLSMYGRNYTDKRPRDVNRTISLLTSDATCYNCCTCNCICEICQLPLQKGTFFDNLRSFFHALKYYLKWTASCDRQRDRQTLTYNDGVSTVYYLCFSCFSSSQTPVVCSVCGSALPS